MYGTSGKGRKNRLHENLFRTSQGLPVCKLWNKFRQETHSGNSGISQELESEKKKKTLIESVLDASHWIFLLIFAPGCLNLYYLSKLLDKPKNTEALVATGGPAERAILALLSGISTCFFLEHLKPSQLGLSIICGYRMGNDRESSLH